MFAFFFVLSTVCLLIGVYISLFTLWRKLEAEHTFDMLLAVLLVYWLFQSGSTTLNTDAWFGAFLGLLPDFMEAPRNFFHFNPSWLKPFNDFHHNFHRSTPDMLVGLTPQFVVLALILFFR